MVFVLNSVAAEHARQLRSFCFAWKEGFGFRHSSARCSLAWFGTTEWIASFRYAAFAMTCKNRAMDPG